MKLLITSICATAIMAVASSTGAFTTNRAASSNTGKHEVNISAVQHNVPPATVNLAANKDAAIDHAAVLYIIPDPTIATTFTVQQGKIEGLKSFTGNKEEGINTAGANSGTPQTTVAIMKTDPNVGTHGTTQHATNPGEIAVNSGPNGTAGQWQVFAGTGQDSPQSA